jgi:VanZ family protein
MIMFGIPHFDKVLHLGGYGLLAFLCAFASYKQVGNSQKHTSWIAVVCMTLGIGLEFGQYFMQLGRSFEGLDMVANVLGVAGGLIIAPLCWKVFNIVPGPDRA